MEHPAIVSDGRDTANCLLLPEMTNLTGVDGVGLITFDQCMTGQTAARPTTLLAIPVPEVRRTITLLPNHGRCNHGTGYHCRSTGRSNDGSGERATARTHTTEMCRLLAHAIMDA
eukprot:8258727-Pyramimonas_sp.AAC.1